MELAKAYSHKEVEGKWYRHWVDSGAFAPDDRAGPYFSIVIPPPNVTGSLHMGHALNNTLQDILCRYKRMDGYRVLWVPGTDHAGIATQNVVERRLAEQGLTRAQVGRANFIERVWAWKEEAGNAILHQLKALGVSCDWRHERFTMDEGLSHAVREAFVRLWEDGLLYRAERLINWCPRCKTALADIEVVHEESDGQLWHIRYPLADDPSQALIVATTRPETMLGDTAVAVHPEDARYHKFAGKKIRLPIAGRVIPLLADPYVDKEFGTGALKITPGHDFNDFEIGERFGLEKISIFDADAKIDAAAFLSRGERGEWVERYRGQDRFAARKLIVAELKEKGYLEKTEPYRNAVGHCYRCQTAVEPYLTPQWFVKVKPLAEPAMQVVRDGRVRIIPEGWGNSYFAWMENIKDWCISRQIWWGHQIPAWYCKSCDAANLVEAAGGEYLLGKEARPIVARGTPETCPKCGGNELIQDPDVLDTWFSSGLWPFSTLGWPQQTEDLKNFYPTSTLVTGFDILFFWVARMIMMGLKFMGDVPFRDVYIHALVRDEQGQKMSKSKGNVIDPLDIINQYGTDAFRFTLAAMAAMGRDIRLAEERIAGYQNFVNKLWNAARFVLMNRSEDSVAEIRSDRALAGADLNFAERWIRSRLATTIAQAREAVDGYRFNDYANVLYQFTWHEFCDWYIEMSKLTLNGTVAGDATRSKRILVELLEHILLLLHPLMPFVTEEIWQVLGDNRPSIMVQTYPHAEPAWIDANNEKQMEFLMGVVRAIRNLRAEMNCPPGKEVKAIFHGPAEDLAFLRPHEPYLRLLARVGAAEYLTSGERPKGAATAVIGATEIYLPLGDLINLDEERARLTKEIRKFEEEFARVQKKLANSDFISKAKEEVVRKEREKAGQYEDKIRTLNLSLVRIEQSRAERS
ncbi:MAG: valine--tRNA ligase [Deltaproteobacteria bacterium]|nr:valine--tRNA ligase [Deltaproteobacteria bacterium]MDZ4340859.1 valine--tRNA ligase [Candidatus Binatia bacterium]